MSADEHDHAHMTGLLLEQKRNQAIVERCDALIEKWTPRVALAEQHGRQDLLEEARRQLTEARRERAQAIHRIEVLKQDKSMLRHEVNRPDGMAAAQRELNNEVLLDSFKGLGVDPNEVVLDEMSDEQTADDALAALKARMNRSK